MEGVQETVGKIAVERKLQDEVLRSLSMFRYDGHVLFFKIPKQLLLNLQGEQVYNTLKQQEEMRISGKSARQMVMQVD